MDKKARKSGFFKTINNIFNYFVFPAFLVGAFSVFIIFLSTPQGKPPQIFGISVVRVNTGSMVEKGFNIGDVVFVNQNQTSNLKKGDIVAFYKVEDPYDRESYNYNKSTFKLVTIDEFSGEFAESVFYGDTGRITPTKLQQDNSLIYFHYINEVFVSPEGIVFYQTIGSNPGAKPDGFIRQDFIIAKYAETPLLLKSILSFTVTPAGMIAFVIFPLSVIAGYESFKILKKINAFLLEDKLFKRKMSYKDPSIKAYNVVEFMSTPRKAFYWITSSKEEKDEVFEFLYTVQEKAPKKNLLERENALLAKRIFNEKGALEYFKFWHGCIDGFLEKKEIISYKMKYEQNMLKTEKNDNL